MGRKKSPPRITIEPEARSQHFEIPSPRTTPLTQQKPSFRLECCWKKDFCYIKCDTKQRLSFADKLHELSQLTWNEILNSNRRGLGSERITELDRKKPASVPKEVKIIGLKYHSNRRMAGYRDDEGIFHILWFDHNGKLYHHG